MARIQFAKDANVSKPVKRMRWATTRKTGQSGVKKRLSILQRVPKVHVSSYEEKPAGPNNNGEINGDSPLGQQQEQEESSSRTIYFNQPLPPEAKTEEGHIKAQYQRNKIRTAKYTPLSFVPKNLWFQFHNIANIYFLFTVILSVSSSCPFSVQLLIIPDLLYFWRLKSRLGFRTFDLYLDCHFDQRRSGRLVKDCP